VVAEPPDVALGVAKRPGRRRELVTRHLKLASSSDGPAFFVQVLERAITVRVGPSTHLLLGRSANPRRPFNSPHIAGVSSSTPTCGVRATPGGWTDRTIARTVAGFSSN